MIAKKWGTCKKIADKDLERMVLAQHQWQTIQKCVNATNAEASNRAENIELMRRANNIGSIVSSALNSFNW